MSAALDHEAREVLRLAGLFLHPDGILHDLAWFVKTSIPAESSFRGEWVFDLKYEADPDLDTIDVTWRVWTETDSVDGDPPSTRTRVVRVEVSRG